MPRKTALVIAPLLILLVFLEASVIYGYSHPTISQEKISEETRSESSIPSIRPALPIASASAKEVPEVSAELPSHGTYARPPPKPPETKTMQVFDAVEIDKTGWSRLVDMGDKYLWETRWGNYSIEKTGSWMLRYRFWTSFTSLDLDALAGYEVESLNTILTPVKAYVEYAHDHRLVIIQEYGSFRLRVTWTFYPGPPRSEARIIGNPGWVRILFRTGGIEPEWSWTQTDKHSYSIGYRDSWLVVDFSNEEQVDISIGEELVARFPTNKLAVDPYFYVTAPGTVTVDWSTTGD
ncbi:MAG: hypothetical protein QXP38_00005, partial [Nitrososphaerota archaeon]